jgi:hypothetical protein
VSIKEQGTENEMTSTSPDQTKTLVLKAFDLLFNKHDYDARRMLLVGERYPAQRAHSAAARLIRLSGNSILATRSDDRTYYRKRLLPDLLSAALIVSCAIGLCSVIARADPLRVAANPLPAPVGHAQPRASGSSPSSQAEQAVQDQLSRFDAEQKKLDEQLDKKLSICRC